MSSEKRRLALLVFGVLLTQVAWVMAVPPFRGSDEFDHAYRAASVANGNWHLSDIGRESPHGSLISVPSDLVRAAREICESYSYTSAENCHAVNGEPHGNVMVASGAARYNPAFYAVIGASADPFEGTEALYAMRFATSVLFLVLIVLTHRTLRLWSRSPWPGIALALALTPVVVHSSTIPGPNGIEMAAALGVWAATLGISAPTVSDRTIPRLLLVLSITSATLTTVRTLGPLWWCLILMTAVSLNPARWRSLWTTHRAGILACAAVQTLFTVMGIGWSLASKANQLRPAPRVEINPFWPTLEQIPVWILQSIAAFPTRAEPAPPLVYACELIVLVALTTAGYKRAGRRLKVALLAVGSVSIAIPAAFTLITLPSTGVQWQGRYSLPFLFGLMLLAGYALDRKPVRHRLLWPSLAVGTLCVAIASAVSISTVLAHELAASPLSGDPRWQTGPTWFVGMLAAAGTLVFVAATLPGPRGGRWDPVREPAPHVTPSRTSITALRNVVESAPPAAPRDPVLED